MLNGRAFASQVLLTLTALLAFTQPIKAQVIPDQTLPVNTSISQPGCSNCNIAGGTQVGNNLFHSFEQFSIPQAGSVNFNNSNNIVNIINRVTGIAPSTINGLIKANGNANVFLINPNGVIFGDSAKLDIGGSFVATTAGSLQFGNLGFYSAVNPNFPADLLTINPSAFLFNQIGHQIQVNGNLSVSANRDLFLVGGDISLNNSTLKVPGGKIELAAIATNRNIGLRSDGNRLSLVPNNSERGNISLANNTKIDVTGNGSGSVTVMGRNLQMTQGSTITAGIAQNLTGVPSPGNINISATDKLQMSQGSMVANVANLRSNGKAGNINVDAGNVELTGGIIRTRTLGSGDAGNINIQAGNIYVNNPTYKSPGRDGNLDDKPALDASNYRNDANNGFGQGKSGNVSLTANNSITLIGQGQDLQNKVISTYNRSGGRGGGNISLITNGTLLLSNAYIVSSTFSDKAGGGDIFLQGNQGISIVDKSRVNASSFTTGNSGDITLNSQGNVSLRDSEVRTETTTKVPTSKAGTIRVNGDLVELVGGILRTRTIGSGDAGDIIINANNIYINNPAYRSPGNNAALEDKPALDASNYKNDANGGFGTGRSGGISLVANGSITLIGNGNDEENKVISAYTRRGGKGGGSISLIANDAIFLDNAYLVTSSFSQNNGAAGVLLQGNQSISLTNNSAINAISFEVGDSGDITLSSQGPILLQTSKINTQVGNDTAATQAKLGNAGNIKISGRSVTIKDGTEVKSSSYAGVNSGQIQIIAPDFVEISGLGPFPIPVGYRPRNYIYSSITASNEARAVGTGGNIYIATDTLRLAQGAHIRANTRGAGSGGNITVDAKVLEATGGGQIITTTSGTGNAGNITLNIKDQVNISGTNPNYDQSFQQTIAKILTDAKRDKKSITEAQARSEAAIKIGSLNSASGVFANTSNGSTGQGGDLTVNTNNLTVRDDAKLTVASDGLGSAGNADINARTFILDGASLIADTRSINSDFNREEATINIKSRDLLLLRGANITTNASGSNVIGGNININTDILAALQNSDISANSADFRGGKVIINARGVIGTQFRDAISDKSDITATGASPELSGTVEINRPDTDPSQSLIELPANLVDIANRIDRSCQPGIANTTQKNQFTMTGRGGLPPSPLEPLQADNIQGRWITLQPSAPINTASLNPSGDSSIIEANGWQVNSQGELFLIASAANIPRYQTLNCSASSRSVTNEAIATEVTKF